MRSLPNNSIDFILTDPPYLVDYKSRDGQKIANDNNPAWLNPVFAEMYPVLKLGKFCVCWKV
jgi:site-specific DNA-methyltransferase (adenine-specific)